MVDRLPLGRCLNQMSTLSSKIVMLSDERNRILFRTKEIKFQGKGLDSIQYGFSIWELSFLEI